MLGIRTVHYLWGSFAFSYGFFHGDTWLPRFVLACIVHDMQQLYRVALCHRLDTFIIIHIASFVCQILSNFTISHFLLIP